MQDWSGTAPGRQRTKQILEIFRRQISRAECKKEESGRKPSFWYENWVDVGGVSEIGTQKRNTEEKERSV